MKGLLVMKFGGTSMGSAERMRAAGEIISAQQKEHPLTVVVSAMSKVTDLLLETMRHAELGDRTAVDSRLRRLLNHHLETCEDLFEETASATAVPPGSVRSCAVAGFGISSDCERNPYVGRTPASFGG